MTRNVILFALLLGAASAAEVTPVEKVIKLISDMKSQTEEEGVAEASTYDEFACFCKDTTMKKSKSVTDGQDNIDTLSATIESKTATKEEKQTERSERMAHQEVLAQKLEDTKAELEKKTAEYEVNEADLNKALSSLQGAIKALEDAKPASAAAFITLQQNVLDHLQLTDAVSLDLSATSAAPAKLKRHSAALAAFLQQGTAATVDPSDPDFKYHSGGILKVLDELLVDFRAQKETLDTEWGKTKTTLQATIKDTTTEMAENKAAINQLKEDIEGLKTEIATARGDLIEAQSGLTDDQAYLKDLTERCEVRAKDWDQRSSMRRDELAALTQALDILENRVKSADEGANARAAALLATTAKAKAHKVTLEGESFLQASHGAARASAHGLLDRVVAAAQSKVVLSLQARQRNVQQMLVSESKRLGSTLLGSLAMKVAADPFAKVKELIQKLIERLVKEATEEASKKGFCDTELGKARHSRDSRLMDVDKISVDLKGLEAKKDALEREIEELTSDLKDLDGFLTKQTKMRGEEKANNLATLKEAKEGLGAVSEALDVLKVFYKQAAKASSFIQYSPVDDDTAGAGFKGNYKGNQEGSKAILGLLEVIKSDFERTIKMTTQEESDAAAAFVVTDRTTKMDLGGKSTKKELDEEDLKTTDMKIAKGMENLQANMDLLDSALKELEELKPACVDSGMSYAERVEKREEEMEALKTALCMLDADGVEPECQK